jgi:hypothetical protein
VWCVASLPDGREAAWQLRGRLGSGSSEADIAVGCIVIATDESLGALGSRLEAMLGGIAGRRLTRDDEALYAFACGDGETMLGAAVEAGDVVVLPAGTGHRRIDASGDFLVVGAYPPGQEDYDMRRGDPEELDEVRRNIEAAGFAAAERDGRWQ